MRWVDGHKGVFSVELTAVSSVHPQVQDGMRTHAPWPVPPPAYPGIEQDLLAAGWKRSGLQPLDVTLVHLTQTAD